MVETKVRPQEINIAVTSAELVPSFVGLPWWDNSVRVLKFDTSGNGVPTQFVTALPQHTLTGEHGPKVTITQTAADNALVITQQGNAVAVSLVCGSTNSGRVLDITQAAAKDVINITKANTGAGVCIELVNSGTGIGLEILQQGFSDAIFVQQNTDQHGIHIAKPSGAVSAALSIDNGGGMGLEVNSNGVDSGIVINHGVTSTASALAINVLSAARNGARIIGQTGVEQGSALLRVKGYSPAIELMDKDDVQNWYIGIDDNDANKFLLGRGYGPGQGVAQACTIDITDQVGIGTSAPSARLHVAQTSIIPAVVITQAADSNALNITRSHTGSGADAVNLTNSGSGTALDIMQANASGVALNLDHSSSSSVINVNKVSVSSANAAIKITNSGSLASARDIEGHAGNWWVDKSGNASFTNLVGLVGQVIRFFGAKNTAGVIVGVNPSVSIATGGITVPANTFPNGVLAIMIAECYQFNECELIVESRMTQPAGGTKQFAATPSILARDRAPVAVGGAANLGCAAMYLSGGTNSGEDWDVQSIMGFGLWVKSGTSNMSGVGGSDWDPAKATTIDYYKAYSDHGGGSATRVGRRTIFVFGF